MEPVSVDKNNGVAVALSNHSGEAYLSGETAELDCPLAMFGELPDGTYRIVREGLAVEFDVT